MPGSVLPQAHLVGKSCCIVTEAQPSGCPNTMTGLRSPIRLALGLRVLQDPSYMAFAPTPVHVCSDSAERNRKASQSRDLRLHLVYRSFLSPSPFLKSSRGLIIPGKTQSSHCFLLHCSLSRSIGHGPALHQYLLVYLLRPRSR